MLINLTRKIFLKNSVLNFSFSKIDFNITTYFYYFLLMRKTFQINNYFYKPMENFRFLDMIHYISSGGPLLTGSGNCGKEHKDTTTMRALRFEEFEQLTENDGHKIRLKVMSYNVLSQALLTDHMYLYKNCSPITLKWNYRFPRILGQIIEHNPDILCLQEVQENQLNEFYDKLEDLGYVSVFKKRTGWDKGDGCAIYFRRNMFDLVDDSKVEYFRAGVPRLNRDNVGIIVKLRCKVSNKIFIVANTHLLYNPKRVDVRLAQIQLLLSEIYRLAEGDGSTSEVILTGDLNSLPDSLVVKLIMEGTITHHFTPLPNGIAKLPRCPLLSPQDEDENPSCKQMNWRDISPSSSDIKDHMICHDFNFQSVYPFQVENDSEATTFQNSWVTVDYIFYSGSTDLQLESKFRLPTTSECDKYIKHLPNYANPSDHLPLVATFLFSAD